MGSRLYTKDYARMERKAVLTQLLESHCIGQFITYKTLFNNENKVIFLNLIIYICCIAELHLNAEQQ